MSDLFKNFTAAWSGIWRSIGVAQKTAIVLVIIACVAGMSSVVYFGTKVEWHPLYSNVDEKTMGAIRDVVAENNVEYELKDGGRTILVPHSKVNELRVLVKQKGVHADSDGRDPYELFDKSDMTRTQFEAKLAWRRTKQLVLQSNINKIVGIQSSRVELSVPEKRAFEKKAASTASVFIEPVPGERVSPNVVQSIRHMVAGVISSLEPNAVTVSDNRGNLLASNSAFEDSVGGGEQQRQAEYKAQLEKYYREKAEGILLSSVGVGNVNAFVNADIDFSELQKESETLGVGIITSETTTTEKTWKAEDAGKGATGTASNGVIKIANLDKTKATSTGTLTGDKEVTQKITQVPRTIETLIEKGARLKSLTVAVNINAGETPRSDGDLEAFTNLVASAVGVDAKAVTVVQSKFAPPMEIAGGVPVMDKVLAGVDKFGGKDLFRHIGGVLLMLVLFIMYRKIFAGAAVETQELQPAGAGASAGTELATVGPNGELVDKGMAALEGGGEKMIAEKKKNEEVELINEASNNEPQAIASVIEAWIQNEK